MWINGGYFVLRSELLDDLRPGEELVEEPFHRLAAADQLLAQRHDGFWAPMDTLKDKQWLESLHESGQAPWELWRRRQGRLTRAVSAGLRLMLPLLARPRRDCAPQTCSRSAPIPTTSRSAAAGRSSS